MPPLLPPAAEARTVTVPAPVIVTTLPAIVAGPDAIAKVTGRPDDEVALTANAGSPNVFAPSGRNVIVCSVGGGGAGGSATPLIRMSASAGV